MGYEKRYDMDSTAGRDEAVHDFESWVGAERCALLKAAIDSGEIPDQNRLHQLASLFLGVSGCPVTAWGERNGCY